MLRQLNAATRRETVASAVIVFVVAIAVGAWAASILRFPGQDVAYVVDAARNLVGGKGLTSDAIWSYATPPLSFPRPAFELWLPMPAFLAAIPMAILGPTLGAAQLSSILVGAVTAVLALLVGTRAAAERGLPPARRRAVAIGSGLVTAVYLPLVHASAQPDSTLPFAALALATCLQIARLAERPEPGGSDAPSAAQRDPAVGRLVVLGVLIGLAAWVRNEAIWLAATWAVIAWLRAREPRRWIRLIAIPGLGAIAVFLPWMIRDWLVFGSPLPGQAIGNALSLDGRDIFAWHDPPTLGRYLAAGLGTLISLRWSAFLHNLFNVLVLVGLPISVAGLASLPAMVRRSPVLQSLALFAGLTFVTTTLVFPVVTVAGTFMHSAGAIHVLVIVAAVLGLDAAIAAVARRFRWTRPTAWIGAAAAAGMSVLFTLTLLPTQAAGAEASIERYEALPGALAAAGFPMDANARPVISDVPNWIAYATPFKVLALPNEPPDSVLDLATHFGAQLLIVNADASGIWPEVLGTAAPGATCFTPIPLASPADHPRLLDGLLVFRIDCP